MDFSWLSSLGTNVGNGIGTPPSTTGAQGYSNFTFGDTPVRPAMAISSPTNSAMGVSGGTIGGAGMNTPAGAIPVKNSMSGGSGVGSQLADSIKAIGDAIANYQTAGAFGDQHVAAEAPGAMISPALASFSIPAISRRF